MIVTLVGLDKSEQPGEVPDTRGFPLVLQKLPGHVGECGMVFIRRGKAVDDGVYDEVEPVVVRLLKNNIGSGGQQ